MYIYIYTFEEWAAVCLGVAKGKVLAGLSPHIDCLLIVLVSNQVKFQPASVYYLSHNFFINAHIYIIYIIYVYIFFKISHFEV